ncbi:MAG: nucleoside monophosphate kinase [Candidatus Moranbacteria bacterium]|nr:nucleoside monophosphate kinase [Candidatus Moranbacteria bacterium]
MMTPKNYILLGPPGSGKSTQAELLREVLNLRHIDIGSELRAVAEEDTPFGRALNDIIHRQHMLASDDIMKTVFEQAIRRVPETQGILLDGAPRRSSQIDEVLQVFQSVNRSVSKVIFIDLPEAESISRISKRYLCFGCRRPYILGKDLLTADVACSVCGGKIGQRKDDTTEGVRKRFQIFQSETLPVIEYFEKEGLLLRIDGKREAPAIFQDIREKINMA